MDNKTNVPQNLGISPHWPTRKGLISWFGKTTPWSMDKVIEYNRRGDVKNIHNLPPHTSFLARGARERFAAQALALQGKPWEAMMRDALGYLIFGNQLNFFWHKQFRTLFPQHPQPLRSMNWELMTETMALAFVIGRVGEGSYEGYLTYATLNNGYQLLLSYEDRHRCGLAFMLRLFASWRGDVSHQWAPFAYSEPIYERILKEWRSPDPDVLAPWLLAACDRHTHQSQPDTETEFYDFSSFPRMPLEILLLQRFRELEGLDLVPIKHPLMAPPFDQLPPHQDPYIADELVLNALTRMRQDWPEFEWAVSLDSIRAQARGTEVE